MTGSLTYIYEYTKIRISAHCFFYGDTRLRGIGTDLPLPGWNRVNWWLIYELILEFQMQGAHRFCDLLYLQQLCSRSCRLGLSRSTKYHLLIFGQGTPGQPTARAHQREQARQLRLLKSVLQELASKSKMKWKDLQSQYHLLWSHTCFIIDRNSWATRIIDNWSRNKRNIGRTNVRKWCTILIMQKIQNSDQNYWQLFQI